MAERCRRRVAGAAHLLEQDARMEGKALSDVSVWGCLPCFMLFNPFTANSFVSHAVVVVFLPWSVFRRRISRPKLLLFRMVFCVRVRKKLEFKLEAVSHK